MAMEKIKNVGEFLLDRSNNSRKQSGYVLVVETTGSNTRRAAVKKGLKDQGVEHICLLKSYSEAMRLIGDERSTVADFLGERIEDPQEEMRLTCRLIFLSVTDLSDAPRALETVKELRSHPRFKGAVIVVDFPNIENLSLIEKDKHSQMIALSKEANIEASVVSQSSENITRMIEAAIDHINEKLTDAVFKKLIGIGEGIIEKKNDPQAADLALSTFQCSRVQELLFLLDKMTLELKNEPKLIGAINSKKEEAMAIVRKIQSGNSTSNIDSTEEFQKAIDILKAVVLSLRKSHNFKTDARNTYAPRRLVGEGRAHQLKKNYQKAEEYFLLALKMMDGKFINALIALADLYSEMKATGKEVEALEQAIRINPHNIYRLNETAILHAKSENKKRSLELVENALKEDPEIASMSAGEVYLELGDSVKAQEFFEKSLKREVLAPENLFHTLNRVAISLRKQKKYDEAIRNYKKALRIYPDDSGVYYNMGVVYALKKERGEAKDCFEKALELEPDFAEVKTELARLEETIEPSPACLLPA